MLTESEILTMNESVWFGQYLNGGKSSREGCEESRIERTKSANLALVTTVRPSVVFVARTGKILKDPCYYLMVNP